MQVDQAVGEPLLYELGSHGAIPINTTYRTTSVAAASANLK